MGLSDYIKIEHEEELTAMQLNFKLCQVDNLSLPILMTDDKNVGRVEGTDFDENSNTLFIKIAFMDKPDLDAVKISVRDLGEMLEVHPKAVVKFISNDDIYHLYQFGNAELTNKANGEKYKFNMIRVFAGRVKMETGGWLGKFMNLFK